MDQGEAILLVNPKRAAAPSLRATVFWLALPAVGEQVLNMAVGLTDQFLIGHLDPAVGAALGYDRATALASAGLANMLVWITTTLFIAIAVGATALVARRIGEGDEASAGQTLQQALLMAAVVGLLGTGLSIALGEPLLRLLGATPAVAAIGAEYLFWVALSYVPAALMFAGMAALRGAGDTRAPLFLMGVVNGINIVLSLLLVNGLLGAPALGVEGSAIGSAVARTLGALLFGALLLAGHYRIRLPAGWRLDRALMGKIMRVGAPTAGEQFIFQGAVIIMSSFITGLGTVAFAAHTVAINIESISFLPGFGFAIAATTLVGQSLGAGDSKRAEQATWEALRQGGALMTLLGLVMALFPATIVGWIVPDPAVIEQAVRPLILAGLGQPLLAASFIFVGALRGAGDTTWPLWMRVLSTWGVRVPLLFVLMNGTDWGLFAAWLAMFADFAVQALLSYHRFKGGRWKHIEL